MLHNFLIKEIQLKAIMRYYHTFIKMAKFQNQTKPTAGKDMQQQKLSFVANENAKWYNHSGWQFGSFLETKSGLIMG